MPIFQNLKIGHLNNGHLLLRLFLLLYFPPKVEI
jgi:hypothetical protein